ARLAKNAPTATTTSAAPSRIQYSDFTYCSLYNLLFYNDLPAIQLAGQLLEARFDRSARRRPIEQRAERLRHLDGAPDERLHDRLELGGMRCRAHDPRVPRATRRRQVIVDPEARRGVRAPHPAVARVVLANLCADGLVVNRIGLDGGAQGGEVRDQVPQALHVA